MRIKAIIEAEYTVDPEAYKGTKIEEYEQHELMKALTDVISSGNPLIDPDPIVNIKIKTKIEYVCERCGCESVRVHNLFDRTIVECRKCNYKDVISLGDEE